MGSKRNIANADSDSIPLANTSSPDQLITSTSSNINEVQLESLLGSLTTPYRHGVKPLPPFVLHRLTATEVMNSNQFKESQSQFLQKALIKDNNKRIFSDHELTFNQGQPNDPFTFSFKGESYTTKWGDFMHSIEQPISDYVSSNKYNHPPKDTTRLNSIDEYSVDPLNYCLDTSNKSSSGSSDNIRDIFDSYNYNEQWNGDNRLRAIFDDDTDEPVFIKINDGDTDLEKQDKKWKLKERELKQRARKWISQNKPTWKAKLIQLLMTNAYVPLFFRLLLLSLSAVALGISGNLVHFNEGLHISQQASPLMAVILQSVSIAYLLYISYDEFTSQPLGVRNPKAKIRLVLLDLLFIIFSSANLSLSFQSIYDINWVCRSGNDIHATTVQMFTNSNLCDQQRALSGVLLIVIVVWCTTFTISLFRIVNLFQIGGKNLQ